MSEKFFRKYFVELTDKLFQQIKNAALSKVVDCVLLIDIIYHWSVHCSPIAMFRLNFYELSLLQMAQSSRA